MSIANESVSKYVDYLNFSAPSWKRPESPPRIWRVVESRKKTVDGRILRFAIQEVPKDLEDDVVEFMLKHYIFEEPLCVDQGNDDIGLAYQIPVTQTIFSATASQILATRIGYEVLLKRKCSEVLNDEGKVAYPGVTVESIKIMAKRLY